MLVEQEGLVMTNTFRTGKLAAMLSIATVGAALLIGVGTAIAGDANVTEDQIMNVKDCLQSAGVTDPRSLTPETAGVRNTAFQS